MDVSPEGREQALNKDGGVFPRSARWGLFWALQPYTASATRLWTGGTRVSLDPETGILCHFPGHKVFLFLTVPTI